MLGETIECKPRERHEVNNCDKVCRSSLLSSIVMSVRLAVFGLCVACTSSSYQMPESPEDDAGVDAGDDTPHAPPPTCSSVLDQVPYETPQALTEAAKTQDFVDITEHALGLDPEEVVRLAVNATSFAIGPIEREDGRSHIVMGDAYIAKPCEDSGRYTLGPLEGVDPPRPWSAQGVHVIASRLVDITGDGFPDLITARQRNKIHVFAGLGGGEFSEPQMVFSQHEDSMASTAPNTASMTIMDADGDGRLDILLSRIPTGQVPERNHRYEHTSAILAYRGGMEFEDISGDPEFEHIQRETRSVLYVTLMIPTIDPETNILWLGIDMGDNVWFRCRDMTLLHCERAAVSSDSGSTMGSHVEYDGGVVLLSLSQTAYMAVYKIDPQNPALLTNIITRRHMEDDARGNYWGVVGFGDMLLVSEGVGDPSGPPFPDDVHEPRLSVLRIVDEGGDRHMRAYPDAVGSLSDGSSGRKDWYGMQRIILGVHGPGAIASAMPVFWTTELSAKAIMLAPTEHGDGITVASLAPPGAFFRFTVVGTDGKKRVLSNWVPTSSGVAGQDDPAMSLPGVERVIEMKVRCPDGREEIVDEIAFGKMTRRDTGVARAFFPDLCTGM